MPPGGIRGAVLVLRAEPPSSLVMSSASTGGIAAQLALGFGLGLGLG